MKWQLSFTEAIVLFLNADASRYTIALRYAEHYCRSASLGHGSSTPLGAMVQQTL